MKVRGVIKQWRFPESSERELSRSIQGAIADLVVEMRRRTNAMKFDATDDEINQAEQSLTDYALALIQDLIAYLPAIALTVYKFNTKQWLNVARSAGGSRNPAVILLIATGATASESWYAELYEKWEGMTITSFQKLFGNVISDWSTKIRQANFTGKRQEQVNEMAEQRFAVYSSWGANRASNIVGAWNSRLMRQRIADAGVTHYFWHGMMDDREREQHILWENKRIALDAIHDFPGEPWGCRCWAVPDFSKIGD